MQFKKITIKPSGSNLSKRIGSASHSFQTPCLRLDMIGLWASSCASILQLMKTRPAKFSFLTISLAIALSFSFVEPSNADGLTNGQGHINGPHTDLILTAEQQQQLKRGLSKIHLTDDQRRRLQHIGKGKNVTEISVLPADTQTCTCEIADVAIRVSPSTIEVADCFFGRDLKAEADIQWKRLKAQEEKEFKAEHTQRDSKEMQLYRKAEAIPFDKPGSAIPLLEEALKLNPHLTRAKDKLCQNWNNLGAFEESRGNLATAVTCFQNAVKYGTTDDDKELPKKNLQDALAKLQKLKR